MYNKPVLFFDCPGPHVESALSLLRQFFGQGPKNDQNRDVRAVFDILYLFDTQPLPLRPVSLVESYPIIYSALSNLTQRRILIYSRVLASHFIEAMRSITVLAEDKLGGYIPQDTVSINSTLFMVPLRWVSLHTSNDDEPWINYSVIPSVSKAEDPVWSSFWDSDANLEIAASFFNDLKETTHE